MSKSLGELIEDMMVVTISNKQEHMYFEAIDKGYKLTVSVSKIIDEEVEDEEE